MRCTFCATGKGGFARNLRAHEIIDQARLLMPEQDFWNVLCCRAALTAPAAGAAGSRAPGSLWPAGEQRRCAPMSWLLLQAGGGSHAWTLCWYSRASVGCW